MRPLYEIDEDIRRLFEEAEVDEDGEILVNLEDIEKLQMERDAKVEGVGLLYKEKVAEEKMIADEIKRLQDRKKKLKNQEESLKNYLAYACQGVNFTTARLKISFRRVERVEVEDVSKIPVEFIRVKQEPEKDELKKAIKAGIVIEGVTLVEDKSMSVS